jgi:hypothetical protein
LRKLAIDDRSLTLKPFQFAVPFFYPGFDPRKTSSEGDFQTNVFVGEGMEDEASMTLTILLGDDPSLI